MPHTHTHARTHTHVRTPHVYRIPAQRTRTNAARLPYTCTEIGSTLPNRDPPRPPTALQLDNGVPTGSPFLPQRRARRTRGVETDQHQGYVVIQWCEHQGCDERVWTGVRPRGARQSMRGGAVALWPLRAAPCCAVAYCLFRRRLHVRRTHDAPPCDAPMAVRAAERGMRWRQLQRARRRPRHELGAQSVCVLGGAHSQQPGALSRYRAGGGCRAQRGTCGTCH